MTATPAEHIAGERAGWRAVAVPSEHGGWGLTLEPVVLGLVVAWSGAGVAIGVAAFAAFMVRTPAKLVAVDVRRGRWLARSHLALRIAVLEMVVLGSAVAAATVRASWEWLATAVIAGPASASRSGAGVAERSVTGGRRRSWRSCGVADRRLLLGLMGVVMMAVTQSVWVRRAPLPAKQVGLRQMGMGLALVALASVGVLS